MLKIFKTSLMTKSVLAIGLAISSQIAFAENTTAPLNPQFEQQFFQKFAQCDMSFFKWLKQHQQDLEPYVEMTTHKDHLAFDVELLDNEDEYSLDKLYHIEFKQPLMVNGIQLTGYYFLEQDAEALFDEEFSGNMKIYFWGFNTNEPTLQRTTRKLHQFKWDNYEDFRLTNKQMILNTRKSSKWVNHDFAMGVAPKAHTVEKSLFISGLRAPDIECSAQGDVSPQLLKTLHPEL